MKKILIVLGIIVVLLVIGLAGFTYWMILSENACWKREGTRVIEKYKNATTRAAILKIHEESGGLAFNPIDYPNKNPLEIVDLEFNGCSFGSNGATVVHFHFGQNEKVNKIQVYADYMASNAKLKLIDEKITLVHCTKHLILSGQSCTAYTAAEFPVERTFLNSFY